MAEQGERIATVVWGTGTSGGRRSGRWTPTRTSSSRCWSTSRRRSAGTRATWAAAPSACGDRRPRRGARRPPAPSSTPRRATSDPTTPRRTSSARSRAGAVVVTLGLRAVRPRSAPAEVRDPLGGRGEGGGDLFVSGIDPGWGNDVLPLLLSGLASTIDQVRRQEIFDYSTYEQPDAVRYLVGMGQPMDAMPPMVAPGVPTMVWGGQIRLMARGLGVELDEIREVVERRPLEETVTNSWAVRGGPQGGLRFEVQGIVDGGPLIVDRARDPHRPTSRPSGPMPADGGRRRPPGGGRGPAPHRGDGRGNGRGRGRGCGWQRHGGGPSGQRHPPAASARSRASTTPSMCRSCPDGNSCTDK